MLRRNHFNLKHLFCEINQVTNLSHNTSSISLLSLFLLQYEFNLQHRLSGLHTVSDKGSTVAKSDIFFFNNETISYETIHLFE